MSYPTPEMIKMMGMVKVDLRSLLISVARTGITPNQLRGDYKDMNGRDIPFRELGHKHYLDLIRAIPDVCCFRLNRMGEEMIYPVVDESTCDLADLVRTTKGKKPSKGGGPGRVGSNHLVAARANNNDYSQNRNRGQRSRSTPMPKQYPPRPALPTHRPSQGQAAGSGSRAPLRPNQSPPKQAPKFAQSLSAAQTRPNTTTAGNPQPQSNSPNAPHKHTPLPFKQELAKQRSRAVVVPPRFQSGCPNNNLQPSAAVSAVVNPYLNGQTNTIKLCSQPQPPKMVSTSLASSAPTLLVSQSMVTANRAPDPVQMQTAKPVVREQTLMGNIGTEPKLQSALAQQQMDNGHCQGSNVAQPAAPAEPKQKQPLTMRDVKTAVLSILDLADNGLSVEQLAVQFNQRMGLHNYDPRNQFGRDWRHLLLTQLKSHVKMVPDLMEDREIWFSAQKLKALDVLRTQELHSGRMSVRPPAVGDTAMGYGIQGTVADYCSSGADVTATDSWCSVNQSSHIAATVPLAQSEVQRPSPMTATIQTEAIDCKVLTSLTSPDCLDVSNDLINQCHMQVVLTHFQSLDEFYVVRADRFEQLQHLHKAMQTHYNQAQHQILMNTSQVNVLCVVARLESDVEGNDVIRYDRALVLSADTNHVNVRLLDVGPKVQVRVSQVYRMFDQFLLLDAQAFHASLSGYTVIDTPNSKSRMNVLMQSVQQNSLSLTNQLFMFVNAEDETNGQYKLIGDLVYMDVDGQSGQQLVYISWKLIQLGLIKLI